MSTRGQVTAHSRSLHLYAHTWVQREDKLQVRANFYCVVSSTSPMLVACYRCCLCLRLSSFVGTLFSTLARACVHACVCVRRLCTCQRHFWQSFYLKLGVQRWPLLIPGQKKPSESLLFPRILSAFQILTTADERVDSRGTHRHFCMPVLSRLVSYIS